LSWARLLGGQLVELAGKYRFVLIQARPDFGALEPGAAATAAVRQAAEGLEFVRSGQARVRLTGAIALADEEFATVAEGAVEGMIASVALVAFLLFLAVRSWRLIIPILLTLGVGLCLTLGFAAAAVGTLNLVSVGFGILFVGLAVDFAIQFAVRYREARLDFPSPAQAMGAVTARAGGQILIAAATTAAGFLAFVPTDFAGVAELGLIAGLGMFIAFACTLLFLPAAMTLFRPRAEAAEIGYRWGKRLDAGIIHTRWPVLAGFLVLGGLGAAMIPALRFDADPLNTKDPSTEAMRTLRELMDSPLTNPYSIDIMAPDADAASALAARLRQLPLAEDVMTLDSLVPADQPAKLALIADAASILNPSLAPRAPAAPVTAADIRMAARTAAESLDEGAKKLPSGHPVAAVAADLRKLASAPDDVLLAVNAALTRYLPAQIGELRAALAAGPVTRADVPADLARDWRAPDGRVRVQVIAKADARDSRGLRDLVSAVRGVTPQAGGSAVTITETADTIIGAFRGATIGAFLVIAVILAVAVRRLADVLLVLAPLTLSALLTVAVLAVSGTPLNFANIIALPLLLGVGVSFNVYFVLNWRAGEPAFLGSPTARAVLFSALTTASAFGSLAASRHPGTASMGLLLLISLGCTLLVSLAFLPALLAALRGPAAPPR
jgi:hopanoid biosynthesis associated RND transporter like protein HpnN